MNDKLALLKKAYDSVSGSKEFMAYYLCEYQKLGNKPIEQLLGELKCSEEILYQLALCKSPALEQADSFQQLQILSEFTGIEISQIRGIINHVNSLQTFQRWQQGPLLIAARDKSRKTK